MTHIQEFCRTCLQRTHHQIVHSENRDYTEESITISEHGRGEVSEIDATAYQEALVCMGCRTLAVREALEGPWSENGLDYVLLTGGPGKRDNKIEFFVLPPTLSQLHKETTTALNENTPYLCALGLRMLVEGTCKHLGVVGQNLFERINGLATAGHLTQTQAAVLHPLREQGNEAAHDLACPTRSELELSLDIVEHVLSSAFLLELKATRHQKARQRRQA